MIYLAAPYTHPSRQIVQARVTSTAAAVAYYAQRQRWFYSPILQGHEAERAFGHNLPWETWMAHGFAAIDKCQSICVLQLPGWDVSKGVKAECQYAKENNFPVTAISWDEAKGFLRQGLITTLERGA